MRLIDADAFRQKLIERQITTQFFNPRERHEIGCIIEMLDNTPAVDAVEVCRCRDCDKQQHCKIAQYLGLDGYCSYGESRDSDEG